LYHIRINSPLSQPFHIFYLMRFLVKNFDKSSANRLSLGFRIGKPLQRGIKLFTGIDSDDVQAHIFIGSEYFFKLVLPQKSIINKNTAQSVSDRLMNKHRRDRRVDTSAQPQYHFLVSELAFQHAYRRIDKYIRCPILATTADSDHKIAKN